MFLILLLLSILERCAISFYIKSVLIQLHTPMHYVEKFYFYNVLCLGSKITPEWQLMYSYQGFFDDLSKAMLKMKDVSLFGNRLIDSPFAQDSHRGCSCSPRASAHQRELTEYLDQPSLSMLRRERCSDFSFATVLRPHNSTLVGLAGFFKNCQFHHQKHKPLWKKISVITLINGLFKALIILFNLVKVISKILTICCQ